MWPEGHLWLLGQGWPGTMRQPWGSPLRRSPWQAALRKAGLLGWAWGKFGRRAQSRERHRGKYPRSPAYPESLGGKWDSSSLVPARSPHPAEGVVPSPLRRMAPGPPKTRLWGATQEGTQGAALRRQRAAGGYLGTGEGGAVLGADTPPVEAAAALTGFLPFRSRLRRRRRASSPSSAPSLCW